MHIVHIDNEESAGRKSKGILNKNLLTMSKRERADETAAEAIDNDKTVNLRERQVTAKRRTEILDHADEMADMRGGDLHDIASFKARQERDAEARRDRVDFMRRRRKSKQMRRLVAAPFDKALDAKLAAELAELDAEQTDSYPKLGSKAHRVRIVTDTDTG